MTEEVKKPIIIGSKKGGGGGAREFDDSLFARHKAAIIDVVSEGEIVGLVDGAASVFFNETRVREKNTAEYNFKGYEGIERYGTQDQGIPKSFLTDFSTAAITQDFSSNGKLELDTPQYLKITTGSIERSLTDYLKVSIFTDAMYKVDKKGDNTGDTIPTTVSFDIDFIYTNDAGVQTIPAYRSGFIGKASSKYVHTFGIDAEAYQPFKDWEVKVTRVGGDVSDDDYKVFNNIYCGIIESQITDKLEYPLTAYIGTKLDAEAFGTSIPKRSYDLKGVKISVPTNYFAPDVTAKKITLASATSFAVGDTISSNFSISGVVGSIDSVREGLRAVATCASAHGISKGEIARITISGATVSSGSNYYNGTFDVISTGSTTFNYTMSGNPADNAPGGTIVGTAASGTVLSKSGNDVIVRDIFNRFIINSTVYDTANHSGNSTTISAVADNPINFASYTRNITTGAIETTDQDWDGNFYTSWTDNPAWVYYDLLTNKRYGLGNYINSDDVDKWELFSIGKYCDELVPEPTDSTAEEPRFTCNLYLTKATEAYKVLQDLAAMFRGMQYWINGTIVPVQDREKDPVYQFTDANVIGGMFEYEGSARKTRHNMVKVTYNNPDNFHKQTIEYVQDAELLAKEGSFPQVKNIAAFGCTSRGQALRLGKWVLASEKLNYETIKFKTGLNASFLRPGDIVNVLDARRQGVGWAGRVLKPTTTSQLVTNGTFGSGISSWTQGTATQSHDTSNKRIKLTSGGSAQTPRSYQSLSLITGRTYRFKARAYHGQTAESDQYAKVYISTATNGTGEVTTNRIGTYRTNSATSTYIDFTLPVTSTATYYLQIEGSNLDNTESVTFDSIEVYQVNTITSVKIDRDVILVDDQDYTLTLTKPGYGAKLAQGDTGVTTTIGGLSLLRHALIQTVSSPLNGGLLIGATTITVDNNINYPTAGTVYINNERITYTGKGTNTLTGCTRAAEGTTASAHDDNDRVYYEINTNEKSQKIIDDSNNKVFVDWSPYVYTETKELDEAATKALPDPDSNTVSTLIPTVAFTRVPDDETIWILQKTTVANELKAQQYTILAIAEDGEDKFDITGLKYNASKFDFVDKREALESHRTINAPTGDHVIPIPTNLKIVPAAIKGPAGTLTDLLSIAWEPPKVNTSGVYDQETLANNILPYEFTKGYQVRYQTSDDNENDWNMLGNVIPATINIIQPQQTTYTFQIRTVNMNNMMSAPLEGEFTVTPSSGILKSEGVVSGVNLGGRIDNAIILTTSNVTFGSTAPVVTNAIAVEKAAASDPGALAFVGLSTDQIGYVYWDYSAGTLTAKITDLGNETFYSIGGSEWASATGTVTCTEGSADSKITGYNDSAEFITDFTVGSKIRVNNTDLETYTIIAITDEDTIIVKEPIQVTRSNVAIKKEVFVPDRVNDVILASVTEASGPAWSIVRHAQYTPEVIETDDIATNAVTSTTIALNSITTVHLAINSVTSASIVAGTIDTAHIAANAITNAKIEANSIVAASIVGGTITNAEIAANTITSANIFANTITSAQISAANGPSISLSANQVTSVHIGANQVNTSEISSNSITAVSILANTIGSTQIAANTVNAIIIAQNAVTGVQIVTNAVVTEAIASNSVTSASVATNSIGAIAIVAASITTTEIAADTIAASNIAADAIGSSEVAANAIGAVNISTNSIGAEAIATNSIAALNIVSGSITSVEIASNSIDTAEIVTGAVGALQIAANSIDTAEIVTGAVGALQIAANSIDTAEIVTGSIDAIHISSGAITTAKIGADQITTATINAGAIGNTELGNDAVDSDNIADGSIDTAHIGAGQITTAKIAANNITTALIAANNITAASIVTGAVGALQIAANSIDTAEIVTDSIDTLHISAGAVTNAEISNMSIGKLTAGTLTVAQTVGTGAKILIDGANNRIVISD